MRLTIGNLFVSEQLREERKRSAGILARKPGQLNPPYAGCRDATGAGYKVRDAMVARPCLNASSSLRTQGPIRRGLSLGVLPDAFVDNFSLWLWVPAFAGTTDTVTSSHTAVLR